MCRLCLIVLQSKLGLGTYNSYVDDDRNSLVCTSEEKVKDVCK